ncbi:gliding motility-associated C-terminal domain-containing protein [Rapidithrix thailandica]|uniref:Gliding motility-associated C-terminal domain-containing protein n=1 Tax=Rapidithrix thailandica TaxID=413964 RepID=A0AAW9S8M9_9BACT
MMMRVLFLTLFFSVYTLSLTLAQEACFKVNVQKGCEPLTVVVTNCSTADLDNITYDYGAGEGEIPDTEYTYEEPGVYTITQYVGGNNTDTKSLTIDVKAPQEIYFQMRLCQGKKVNVLLDDTYYDQYRIAYGDGTVVEVNSGEQPGTHTYSTEGEKRITVQGLFEGTASCGSTEKSMEVYEILPVPEIHRLEALSENGLRLGYTTVPGLVFALQEKVGSGTYQTLRTLSESGSSGAVTLNDKFTGQKTYCYRLQVLDPCTDQQVTTSEELCSVGFELSSKDRINTLEWQAYPGAQRYEIYRDEALLARLENANQYNDEEVLCGKTYTYFLKVVLENAEVISLKKSIETAKGNPPAPVNQAYASVTEDGKIKVSWEEDSSPSAEEKKVNIYWNNVLQETVTINGSNSISVDANAPGSYCFEIFQLDGCGQESEKVSACAAYLQGQKSGGDTRLSWTAFQGWDGTFAHYLEVYDEQGSLWRTEGPFSSGALQFTDPESNLEASFHKYRLRIENTAGSGTAYSNWVEIQEPVNLKVPEAFSPNGDGLNDTFVLFAKHFQAIHLRIYDRWGNEVFASSELENQWDGNHTNGQPLPQGGYTYLIQGIDTAGKGFSRKGMVMIVR